MLNEENARIYRACGSQCHTHFQCHCVWKFQTNNETKTIKVTWYESWIAF